MTKSSVVYLNPYTLQHHATITDINLSVEQKRGIKAPLDGKAWRCVSAALIRQPSFVFKCSTKSNVWNTLTSKNSVEVTASPIRGADGPCCKTSEDWDSPAFLSPHLFLQMWLVLLVFFLLARCWIISFRRPVTAISDPLLVFCQREKESLWYYPHEMC